MLTPRSTSQPVYPPLDWDATGTQHILFAAAEDAALAQRLFEQPPRGALTVICLRDEEATGSSVWQRDLPSGSIRRMTRRLDSALQRLADSLAAAPMGARLYLVGSEDLIWQASQVADRYGMGVEAVRRQRTATLARPVFCVHCRSVTRRVSTNVVDCEGCGRALFVRDHFSRRLGAYMGFQVDAEAPGQRPAVQEVYP
ncbi:MAG: hypothetical protein H0W48_15480 [Methylibium sp.]|nr:hypothetical protein [Methylibium sp.]